MCFGDSAVVLVLVLVLLVILIVVVIIDAITGIDRCCLMVFDLKLTSAGYHSMLSCESFFHANVGDARREGPKPYIVAVV